VRVAAPEAYTAAVRSGAEVIVVGGGVIGSAIAYSLAKRGSSVVLLERGEIGAQASGAAAGLLMPPAAAFGPGPFHDLCHASLALYPSLVAALEATTGIDVQFLAADLAVVAETEEAAQGLRLLSRLKDSAPMDFEWVDAASLRLLEPGLSPAIPGAALAQDGRHVNPGHLTQALARAAESHGAALHQDSAVIGFSVRGDRVRGVRTKERTFESDQVVLAAGPWTRSLARKLHRDVPTRPIRGQMLAYRPNPLRHIIWAADSYLVPKAGGFLYVGATEEDVGFRPDTTQRGLAWLRRVASRLAPAVRYSEVATNWAGLRPGSPDRLPMLGRLPGWGNVTVATGHLRNGILLAPITAELVTQWIATESVDRELEPFLPSRFG
jgi:glycine oxidase